MKKENAVPIFVCAAMFVCLICGVLLGRHSVKPYAFSQTTVTTTGVTQEVIDKIDLSTATVEDLSKLPGIGEVIAQRILDYRRKNNGFQSVYDLLNIEGIGEKRFEEISDLVTVGG